MRVEGAQALSMLRFVFVGRGQSRCRRQPLRDLDLLVVGVAGVGVYGMRQLVDIEVGGCRRSCGGEGSMEKGYERVGRAWGARCRHSREGDCLRKGSALGES